MAGNVTRRQGREWALQMLVQADMNPDTDIDSAISNFWKMQYTCVHETDARPLPGEKPQPIDDAAIADDVAPRKMREFSESRVRGVVAHLDEIDGNISGISKNWHLFRLGTIERNVLRLACYELMFCPDVPPPVVMNEAIDLAKYFSNAEAGRFVNGVLDKMRENIEKTKA